MYHHPQLCFLRRTRKGRREYLVSILQGSSEDAEVTWESAKRLRTPNVCPQSQSCRVVLRSYGCMFSIFPNAKRHFGIVTSFFSSFDLFAVLPCSAEKPTLCVWVHVDENGVPLSLREIENIANSHRPLARESPWQRGDIPPHRERRFGLRLLLLLLLLLARQRLPIRASSRAASEDAGCFNLRQNAVVSAMMGLITSRPRSASSVSVRGGLWTNPTLFLLPAEIICFECHTRFESSLSSFFFLGHGFILIGGFWWHMHTRGSAEVPWWLSCLFVQIVP